jgi:ParB-like chromosome segregation protein Spo0J
MIATHRSSAGSTKTLRIDRIRLDGDTQSRVELNDDVIHEYAELLKAKHEFPPLLVVFDGTDYWLVDGFHRRWAAVKAKVAKFKCKVVKGTREDARWLSYGANLEHGVRRDHEDKRKAVLGALKHPRGLKLSDRLIAEHVGVSAPTVAKYREQITATVKNLQSDDRTGRDGRTINVANISHRNPKPLVERPENPRIANEINKVPYVDPRPAQNGSQKPERSVYVDLRAVFDKMNEAERKTAATMWHDWMTT